ncbi:hypothetical protein COV81_01230 [Candidatus Peregrinibacteria bacterium CG11_big_fil_rev_8_21_14_0_20_41_10]|nr:MAG: hypothetical protein COV81_01230 [Candidatus Peregrinibacteria bacterium CG11_big_fil_rev_8_21_14_0_20_41_10]PIZ77362.1 MAG: hypothetical protein COY06_00695 [Candidatus Peregrinibacteria bacterium CG_4_10_14_0_2_um_filter_41_8]PJC37866.1 MAG: hypothetical protein CO045_03325 [Candidatus Peregrinibacteria bacterium CG_4_9_14_0_2_um_filter_41_14]
MPDDTVIEGETLDAEPSNVPEPKPEHIPGDGGVIDEVKGILAELHIGRSHFFGIIAFIVSLILIIVASFVFLLGYLNDSVDPLAQQNKAPEIVVTVPAVDDGPGFLSRIWNKVTGGNKDEVITEEPVATENPVVTETPVESDISTVKVVTDIGKEEALPTSKPVENLSTDLFIVINQLGAVDQLPNRLSYYVRTYRRMQNIFNTDIFLLLDSSSVRNAAFDQYLDDLKASYAEATRAYEDIRQETAILNETLVRLEETRNASEERYLDAADQLASERLPELLETYQRLAEQYIVVRSEVRAREQIIVRYERGLPIVTDKILAVESNRDAFVKGVKVIDFPTIDLDLVIPAE